MLVVWGKCWNRSGGNKDALWDEQIHILCQEWKCKSTLGTTVEGSVMSPSSLCCTLIDQHIFWEQFGWPLGACTGWLDLPLWGWSQWGGIWSRWTGSNWRCNMVREGRVSCESSGRSLEKLGSSSRNSLNFCIGSMLSFTQCLCPGVMTLRSQFFLWCVDLSSGSATLRQCRSDVCLQQEGHEHAVRPLTIH